MDYQHDPILGDHLNTGLPDGNSKLQDHLQGQDSQLNLLHLSLRQVHQQTALIHGELVQQHSMLTGLHTQFEETDSRLQRASFRLKRLYTELTDKKFTWTASFLIFIMFVLLIVLIVT